MDIIFLIIFALGLLWGTMAIALWKGKTVTAEQVKEVKWGEASVDHGPRPDQQKEQRLAALVDVHEDEPAGERVINRQGGLVSGVDWNRKDDDLDP